MPQLAAFFDYRILDLSSVKLVINRWTKQYKLFKKSDGHRALDDIKESIAELKFYKETFFDLSKKIENCTKEKTAEEKVENKERGFSLGSIFKSKSSDEK